MFEYTPKHIYLVGIDSDGCAFDSMEVKHKECFIPNTINTYNLQGVSKYAREAAEFVNLYSKSRGINRFPALVETLEWLQRRPEVKARGIEDFRVFTDVHEEFVSRCMSEIRVLDINARTLELFARTLF